MVNARREKHRMTEPDAGEYGDQVLRAARAEQRDRCLIPG